MDSGKRSIMVAVIELSLRIGKSVDSSEILELSGQRATLLDSIKPRLCQRAESFLLREIVPMAEIIGTDRIDELLRSIDLS